MKKYMRLVKEAQVMMDTAPQTCQAKQQYFFGSEETSPISLLKIPAERTPQKPQNRAEGIASTGSSIVYFRL